MKSVMLMFIGGLVGSMIGPLAAMLAATAGYVIGQILTDLEDSSSTNERRSSKQ